MSQLMCGVSRSYSVNHVGDTHFAMSDAGDGPPETSVT